ncbi:hypothetical protein P7M42_07235 [Vibrio parahaemolyticus]|nr:hypothetical protein [Vibrio parahaemolyticus]
MPSFVSIESPKLGSAVQVNNEENNTVVSVEQSAFGSVAQIIENEIVNVYELDNTDIQSYYNEVSRQHSEDAQAAQLAAEAAQSAAETAESNAKASELDAEAAQVAAETAQSKAETAQSLSEAARNASQTAQSLSETAQAAAELAETNAKLSELDAEAAQLAAEAAQANAETAESGSVAARNAAQTAQSLSETARNESQAAQAGAELAETNAKLSELDAEAAQLAAEAARDQSQAAQAAAELAESGAQTAEANAEFAQVAAETAQANAQIAESGSISARDDSVTAKLASEAARNTALAAQTGAEAAETAAQTHASDANAAKVAAQTAQANAETAQSAAETAEANAQASASSAATSAQSASDDAARAEAAANTAVNTLSAKGDWDASTGVYPTPTPNSADFYQISVAGTMTGAQGSMQANIGDQLYWNVDKAIWYKIDNTDHVISVNGQEGTVVLDHTDVGALGATENAVSASKWQTARTLTLNGDASGAVSIDGSSNATLTVAVANDSHTHDGRYHTKTEADSRFANVSGDTFNGNVAISKGAAKLVLTESDYSTNNSGIDFKTATANQNLEMIHEVSDGKINTNGGNGQALIVRQTSGSAQAGLEVEGEIFAKANQRVFHDAYHPNADKLTTARTINGTSFNGTANITTANWGTARTLTIGNTARSVNGSSNVSWSLAEIGAAPSGYGLGTYGRSLPSSILGDTALRRESGFWQGSSVTGLPTYGHSWKYLWTQAHSNSNGYWGYIGIDFDCTAAFFGGQSAGADKTAIRLFADNYHPNADKWTAARTLTLAGDLSGSVSIDGSSNVTLTAAVADNSHNHTNLDGITKLRFGPGVSANDDAAIEWLGASNAGYLRFSTADDNGTEYMQFGDYDNTAQGGAFTQWLKMYRGQAQFTGNVSASTFTGALSGNASTSSKWATGRAIKIGNASKTVDGSANVTWSISEIGAAPVHARVVNDYNSYRESGFYGVNGTGSNAPSNNGYGTLIVARNLDTGLQLAGGHSNNMLAFRGWSNTGGTWQSWRNLFHDTYHPNADKWTTARTLTVGKTAKSVDGTANVSWSAQEISGTYSADQQSFGSNNRVTTDEFISLLSAKGAFSTYYWVCRGSWSYAAQVTVDTGYGTFGTAGSVIEVIGSSATGCTIRVTTPTTASGATTRREFIYVSNGTSYSPGWRAPYGSHYHPLADKLTTARTISLTGDASGSASFDGSANATLSVTVANDSHTHDSRYYTKSESNSRFAQNSEFSTGATYTSISGKYLPKVTTSGVLEVARYIDFHTNNSTADYDVRLDCNSNGSLSVVGGTLNGSFVGSLSGNASTSTWADTVDVNSGNTSANWYDVVWHSGDTVYSSTGVEIQGSTNSIKSNRHYFAGTTYHLREATGDYGTVATYGRKNGWGGYSIEGRVNFMHNGSTTTGIYNDVDNEWLFKGTHNGGVELYYNGSSKLQTTSSGVSVSGTLSASKMSVSPVTSSNSASTYSIASQGAGVYAVLWSQSGQSNYSTILIWDGSTATLNGDYGNGLVPAINNSGTIYSAASTNWKPKRVVKIG